MKKKFLLFILIIFVIIGSGLLYINYKSTDYINQYLSKAIKSEVSIESVSLGFKSLEIIGLKVKNPTDAAIENAFQASNITIEFDPSTLFNQTVQIDCIEIENPIIGIEFHNLTGSDNNWKNILTKMDEIQDKVPSDSTEKIATSSKSKEVIINELLIHDLKIEAQHQLLGPYKISIPVAKEITIHHLTSQKAITLQKALSLIFQTLLQSMTDLKGFHELLKNFSNHDDIFNQLLDEVKEQLPKQNGSKLKKKIDSEWEELSKDVEEGAKKAKDFFNKIIKSW